MSKPGYCIHLLAIKDQENEARLNRMLTTLPSSIIYWNFKPMLDACVCICVFAHALVHTHSLLSTAYLDIR